MDIFHAPIRYLRKTIFFEPSAAQSAPNAKCPKPHINERFRAFFCVKNHAHSRLFTEFMSNTGARYVCNRLRQRHEYFIYLSFIHLSASCMFFLETYQSKQHWQLILPYPMQRHLSYRFLLHPFCQMQHHPSCLHLLFFRFRHPTLLQFYSHLNHLDS